jgi:Thiamine pyrophosphate enzyme, C-terminal TPP binding domain
VGPKDSASHRALGAPRDPETIAAVLGGMTSEPCRYWTSQVARCAEKRALSLQKCQPGRQVVCLAGYGGFAALMGALLTTVQETLPIKVVVDYDNGKLGFGDIERKTAGLLPEYTDLKNPNFLKLRRQWAFGVIACRRRASLRSPSRRGSRSLA